MFASPVPAFHPPTLTKGNHVSDESETTSDDDEPMTFTGFTDEEKAEMIRKGNAHRFEYHVFHAGETHRIGRVAHEDLMDIFGEWCIENRAAIVRGAAHAHGMRPMPVYLFMDGSVWGVFQFKALIKGRIVFKEVSFFGSDHMRPIDAGERVFKFNEGKVK